MSNTAGFRAWKWAALAFGCGLLLQVGTCATDFAYMVAQGLASQVAAALTQQLLGTGQSTTTTM